MDNGEHKVKFLNELAEEYERQPDADSIVVRKDPESIEEAVEWVKSFSRSPDEYRLLLAVLRTGAHLGRAEALNEVREMIKHT